MSLTTKLMDTRAGQVIISRLAVMASGLGIALLAPLILKPAEQGYFFTFMSLASLQGLFELGITALLIQHFAHSKGDLQCSPVVANDQTMKKVAGIYFFAFNYFKKAAFLFTGLVGLGGALFFKYSHGDEGVQLWLAPWVILTGATAISLYNLSSFCAVEGFGSLQASYKIRTNGILILFVVFVMGMLVSGGLYAHPIALLVSQIYCAIKLRQELAKLQIQRPADPFEYPELENLRANQRKFAVSAIAGFFTASSITPYAFHYFGPVIAGQVGLSLSMFMAAASLAMAFSTADAPMYGQLLAQGKTLEVYRSWQRNIRYSLLAAVIMSSTLLIANLGINRFVPIYSGKVLDWAAFISLGIMIVVNTSLTTVSTVLRAFKTEVLMWPSIIAALFSLFMQFILQATPANYFLGMAIYNGVAFLPYAFYLMMRRLKQHAHVSVSS